jgi:hypothetical protein
MDKEKEEESGSLVWEAPSAELLNGRDLLLREGEKL